MLGKSATEKALVNPTVQALARDMAGRLAPARRAIPRVGRIRERKLSRVCRQLRHLRRYLGMMVYQGPPAKTMREQKQVSHVLLCVAPAPEGSLDRPAGLLRLRIGLRAQSNCGRSRASQSA
jgi:hypothetical protein